MPASIDKLLKILLLEAKNFGYSDHAIIGGLQKLLPSWLLEASVDNLPANVIESVKKSLSNYESLSTIDRFKAVHQLTVELKADYPDDSKISQAEKNIALTEPQPVVETGEKIQEKPGIPVTPPNRQASNPIGLNAPLTALTGVGKVLSDKYASVGVNTLGDLLYYFPRRYDDYSQLKPINRLQFGDELTIIATVQSTMSTLLKKKNMTRIEVVVSDGTGFLRLNFFRGGSEFARYFENKFKRGDQLVISGKVEMYLGRLQMNNPDFEPLEKIHLSTNGIIPVYPLTSGLTQTEIRRDVHQLINSYCNKVNDFLPSDVKR